jgi:hypothetical protein
MTTEAPTAADLDAIWRSCLRHGQTVSEADEVLETIMRELDEGDSDLFEFFLEHAKRELH